MATRKRRTRRTDTLDAMPIDAITAPGTYYINLTGQLLRIPDEALGTERSLAMRFVGRDPLAVTCLSDDPFLPLSRARSVAAAHDLEVKF